MSDDDAWYVTVYFFEDICVHPCGERSRWHGLEAVVVLRDLATPDAFGHDVS